MKFKNPIFFILVCVFALVNLADAITAMFILPAETNPLFLIGGGIIFLDILKIIFVGLMFFVYMKNQFPTNFNYFMFITVLVLGSFIIGVGVYSNVLGIMNPDLVAIGAEMPMKEKITQYFWFVGLLYILPVILNLLCFKFYEWSKDKAQIKK